jgi:hypothetical protein
VLAPVVWCYPSGVVGIHLTLHVVSLPSSLSYGGQPRLLVACRPQAVRFCDDRLYGSKTKCCVSLSRPVRGVFADNILSAIHGQRSCVCLRGCWLLPCAGAAFPYVVLSQLATCSCISASRLLQCVIKADLMRSTCNSHAVAACSRTMNGCIESNPDNICGCRSAYDQCLFDIHCPSSTIDAVVSVCVDAGCSPSQVYQRCLVVYALMMLIVCLVCRSVRQTEEDLKILFSVYHETSSNNDT